MKLLNEIEKYNKKIEDMTESIDSLLLTESLPLWQRVLTWMFRRKVRKTLTPGLPDKTDDDNENEEAAAERREKLIKRLKDEKLRKKDVDDVVDDVSDITGSSAEANAELRELLDNILKQQQDLVVGAINEKSISNITVNFNEPIMFKLKRGEHAGKELRLEKTKTYPVFNIDKKGKKYKVYFLYKTRDDNWLRKYSIMFSMVIKNLEKGQKHDGVTIDLVYMNEALAKNFNYKVLEEKPLTHRAMVEIKSVR